MRGATFPRSFSSKFLTKLLETADMSAIFLDIGQTGCYKNVK